MDISSVVVTQKDIDRAIEIVQVLDKQMVQSDNSKGQGDLSELIEILHNTKSNIDIMQNLIKEREQHLEVMKEQSQIEIELHYDEPYYWRVFELGIDGPYCQNCYDSDGKLIRLQEEIRGAWLCLACSANYKDQTY